MIRVVIALMGIIIGMTGPAQACSPRANSTFCADGWVAAQPMGRAGADEQNLALEGAGDGAWDPPATGGEDIYVEGAVMIGDPPAHDDEPL
ncbi:hypothetical protein [Paracoccus sp. SSK6]|uniref:hypothetical protein n=1 Tax=Paracoccus sp. SSK6 TaxID=3143131 RepID=UPI00321AF9BC